MTEKADPNSRFFGDFTYEGESRDDNLVLLGFYLKGKPDTPKWRDAFAQSNYIPLEFKRRIFPSWAIEDARILIHEDAQTIIRILAKNNLTLEDIPPLITGSK